MRIVLTYNLRTSEDESQAERFRPEYVALLHDALEKVGNEVIPVEASGPPDLVIEQIVEEAPDLVFNMAEGTVGEFREALFPALFEFMNIPYTGGGPELLAIGLDKRLTEELLEMRGVRVPRGCIMRDADGPMRADMEPPFFVKPNYEGSSMGISEESIVHTKDEARERVRELLKKYPAGIEVEEFIAGREITVPFLAAYRQPLLEPVEYAVPGSEHNIMDYETKSAEDVEDRVETKCPAPLTDAEREEVMGLAAQAFSVLRTPDFGRVDLRLDENGKAYLIEVNALPGLRMESPVVTSALAMGLRYEDIIHWILVSAKRRYGMAPESRAREHDSGGAVEA